MLPSHFQRNTTYLPCHQSMWYTPSTIHSFSNLHHSFHPTSPINKPPPQPIFFKLKSHKVSGIFSRSASLHLFQILYTHFFSKTFSLFYILTYIQGFWNPSLASPNQALSHQVSSSTTTSRPPEGLPKFDQSAKIRPNLRRIFPANFSDRFSKVVSFSFLFEFFVFKLCT